MSARDKTSIDSGMQSVVAVAEIGVGPVGFEIQQGKSLPPRRPMPVPGPRASAPDLTPAELIMVTALRAMDEETQEEALAIIRGLARDFPRHFRPSLRLIAGGAA